MKKLYFLLLLIVNISSAQSLVEDPTFTTGTGFNNWSGFGSITVDRVQAQTDGKIIVVGQYINYNGTSANCIIRLNPNGTKDTSFNVGTGTNAGIWGCTLQSDGKILIFGGFTSYNGVSSNRIVRLNTDGTKDATFTIGTGPSNYLESVKVQPDGKIIIGGSFTSYNGTPINRVARLNANGTLDTGFTVGIGADDHVRDIAIQSDGKVLVSGNFFNFNGAAKQKLVRLNANGTIDTAYNNAGTGPLSNVWTIALQSDGKLLIGGEFQAYNGIGRNRIARLNTDGTLDTTFDIGSGASSTVMSLFPDVDGRIYLGGSFTSYNGTGRERFARLNPDGSLDETLTLSGGFDNWVTSISKQADNKLLIGGNFTTFNGATKNRIVRTNAVNLNSNNIDAAEFKLYPNPTTSLLYIETANNFDHYSISDSSGRIIAQSKLTDDFINVQHLAEGIYILTLAEGNATTVRKFIKY
ncbi:MAG TPA: T9SS type A sorting domain-containing protein [Flavobacterium sp.]|jgi:uncharacterized delta-60 repeat protein